MQASLRAFLTVCALVVAASTTYGVGLCEFLGIGAPACGCGNPNCCDGCEPNRWIDGGCGCETGCGCEPACGCGCGDCCEAGCGCESSCGCGGAYCVDGRKFAGRTYNCGCESYMPFCGCTGPSCCDSSCGCGASCGCSDCCEADCGCEASCGCGTDCGDCCEPSCGCGDCGCKKHSGCRGFFAACGRMCSAVCGGGSCGCSGEVYWSEWHNDPPRCCDPCNRCGQWVGPSAGCGGCGCGGGCSSGGCSSCDCCGPSGCGCDGGYSPYAINRPTGAAHGGTTFAAKQRPGHLIATNDSATTGSAVTARKVPNPYRPTQSARRPQQGAKQQVQR